MRENSLGWDDGMDSVEALQELEALFRIKIEDAEAKTMETVGDMFDIIIAKRPPNQSEKCGCAMAFYRLRHAIGDRSLTPLSPIGFVNERGAKKVFLEWQDKTGLRLPPSRRSRLGKFGCATAVAGSLALAAFVVAFFGGHGSTGLVAAFSAVTLGIVATRLDKGLLPRECETLGGLAKATAARSYGALEDFGARARAPEMWDILTECLAERATVSAADINRDTTFYTGQKRKAA